MGKRIYNGLREWGSFMTTTRTIAVPTSDRKNHKVNQTPIEINDATHPRAESAKGATWSVAIVGVMRRTPMTHTRRKQHSGDHGDDVAKIHIIGPPPYNYNNI